MSIKFSLISSAARLETKLTLTVTTPDGRTLAVSAYQLSNGIESGHLIEQMQPPIEIPDLVLTEDDNQLIITCLIVNQGQGATLSDALTTAGVLLWVLGAATGVVGGFYKVMVALEEAAAEIAGAILSWIGAALFGPRDCSGPVFFRAYTRSSSNSSTTHRQSLGGHSSFPSIRTLSETRQAAGMIL